MARSETRYDDTEVSAAADRGCVISRHAPDQASDSPVMNPLRPRTFAEFIGQEQSTGLLKVALDAAKRRGAPAPHVLFTGPPGLGKTTLAGLIATEMGSRLHLTSAAVLERTGDLASLLSSAEPHDVVFIDEIHRLPPALDEFLYPALEDGRLDIRVAAAAGAQMLSLPLSPLTIVGASTRPGSLSAPLRDRFGIEIRLEPYDADVLASVVLGAASKIGVRCTESAAHMIAHRSRGTPRIALRFLDRARDQACVEGHGAIDDAVAGRALDACGIDDAGLDRMDRALLHALMEKHRGAPTGLTTLSASIGEDAATIAEAIEPYLIRSGFLERTPRGRIATPRAYHHFGLTLPGPMTTPGERIAEAPGLPYSP